MSVATAEGGLPVHYPHDPDKFEFDEEVASIFDDMARRAIPLYDIAHELQVAVMRDHMSEYKEEGEDYRVIDIGCSTGKFFRTLCNQLQIDPHFKPPGIDGVAVDPSADMVDRLRQTAPWVRPLTLGLLDLQGVDQKFDAVNLSYVLQFIPKYGKRLALKTIFNMLKPGGVLMMSQKERIETRAIYPMMQEYKQWKMRNGYTEEEIDAKTKALRNSMWTSTQEQLYAWLEEAGFVEIQETSRWSCFSSLVCYRPDHD